MQSACVTPAQCSVCALFLEVFGISRYLGWSPLLYMRDQMNILSTSCSCLLSSPLKSRSFLLLKHDQSVSYKKMKEGYITATYCKCQTFGVCDSTIQKMSMGEDIHSEKVDQKLASNKKMTELEQRQDQLLEKLDVLYDRIKTISLFSNVNTPQGSKVKEVKQVISTPDEIVVVLSPDNLPWFLNIFLKQSSLPIKITWHIHSSVPNEKVSKVKAFVKKLQIVSHQSTINLRLIFKCDTADSELRLSSLTVPLVGNVNILRYLSFAYPSVIPYDHNDYYVDSLLDLCHMLERSLEENKEGIINKLFLQCKTWIHKNEYSIVDLAAYNVVKQWQNGSKYVPKIWFDKCEKMCL